jgi:Asp/Glu/hydantoin racemase
MPDDKPRVGVVHATLAALPPVRDALADLLPQVTALNVLDEGLLDGLNRAGQLTPGLIRRLATVVGLAESAGVRLILTTCSAYSPVMETMRTLTAVPIITIDEVLFAEAVRAGEHLGIIATSERSLHTSLQGLADEAALQRRHPRYTTAVEPAAFAALRAGDVTTAAGLIETTARQLIGQGVDAIMLAQASLARTLPLLGDIPVPILTSPVLAVHRVARELGLTVTSDQPRAVAG